MKHFLVKTLIFALVAAGIFQFKSYRLMRHDKYRERVLGSEVYYSIDKSKKRHKARKILLGDSVGKQLFDNTEENDTVNSLACNQAISMAGQYILLDNYLKAGNAIDTVYVFFLPFSFSNNLDQIFTYNYFVKQFDRNEYQHLISGVARQQLDKIPLTGIAQFPAVLTSNWAPDYQPEKESSSRFLSPVSVDYLHKMLNLAKKHHFKLVLRAAPVSEKKKREVAMLDKGEIAKYHLQDAFKGYFESIIYIEEKHFMDGTHLIHPENFKGLYKNTIK